MRPLPLLLAGVLAAAPTLAQDDAFGDLFGDTLDTTKNKKLDDIEAAASGVKVGGSKKSLQVKGSSEEGKGGVDFIDQFVAERIVITEKDGCTPANKERMRISYLEYEDYPAKSPKLSLCMKMSSRVNRQVRLTANIVNARKKRIGRAETVVSFAGVTRTDHVLDYPELNLETDGPYFLAIDIDGKSTVTLPLFEVRRPQ